MNYCYLSVLHLSMPGHVLGHLTFLFFTLRFQTTDNSTVVPSSRIVFIYLLHDNVLIVKHI